MTYWPWWAGGLALATVALGYFVLQGRLLGVSGSFANVLKPGWPAHLTLLIAITVGGTIGALSRGAFALRLDLGPEHLRLIGGGWRSWAALVAGGLLVGFGTAMAGGCTSGHGLCGTSRLQSGSLIATASFFGAAVLLSLFLMRLAS